MKKKSTLDEKVKQTMESLDDIQAATTDSYFYTRLKARMQREEEVSNPMLAWIKPAWVLPVFLLLLSLEVNYLQNQNANPGGSNTNYFSSYFEEDLSTLELQ